MRDPGGIDESYPPENHSTPLHRDHRAAPPHSLQQHITYSNNPIQLYQPLLPRTWVVYPPISLQPCVAWRSWMIIRSTSCIMSGDYETPRTGSISLNEADFSCSLFAALGEAGDSILRS